MTPSRPDPSELYATYGADPLRWPASARAAFDPDAPVQSGAWQAAAELDEALATLAEPPPPASALRRRILLAAAHEARAPRTLAATLRELWRELGGARIAGPALAMALACGVGLAWMTAPLPVDGADTDTTEDLLALVQFEQNYEETAP